MGTGTTLNRAALRRIGGSVTLALLLIGLFYWQGALLARPVLKGYAWAIDNFSAYYKLERIELQSTKGEFQIGAVLTTRHERTIGNQVIPAGLPLSSATLLAHLYQPIVIAVFCLFLLPFPTYKVRLAALCLTALGFVPILLLDVPFVLVGAVEDLLLYNLAADQLKQSFLVMWMNILNGGGRFALALILVAVCSECANYLAGFTFPASRGLS